MCGCLDAREAVGQMRVAPLGQGRLETIGGAVVYASYAVRADPGLATRSTALQQGWIVYAERHAPAFRPSSKSWRGRERGLGIRQAMPGSALGAARRFRVCVGSFDTMTGMSLWSRRFYVCWVKA